MIFQETKLKGAYIIEPERLEDERGFFARTFCQKEFEKQGLNHRFVQCNISFNKKKATLRGMHYQVAPHEEAKIVSCARGAIYDVIVDLRPGSPTFKQWFSVELTADNRKALYIPEGFAHGFQTLEDETEIFYQMSEFYHPESARGLRYDDPAFGIEWPVEACVVASKDRSFGSFENAFEPPSLANKASTVVFWGATGQAKVLKECIEYMDLELLALFDNNKELSSPFEGVPLYYGKAGLHQWLEKRDSKDAVGFFAAIGGDKGKDRIEIQEHVLSLGLEPLVAIHPTAFVADSVQIGAGTQIMANSTICVGSVLGRACIINTSAIVDHECRLGDGVHIGPGATLTGCVEVDDYATVYSGAVVLPRIKIGKGATVGAGAIVREDVPEHTVVVGNPGKILKGA